MGLLRLIGPVLMAVNFFAAPVAIVWLIVLGEWWAVGVAALSLFSHFLLSILLLPTVILAAPAAVIVQRRPGLAVIAGLPALVYTAGLITVWCIGILLFLMARATEQSWAPLLLLSYSVGTAPWAYMAQQEVRGGGGEGSMIATFFMQIAFIAVICYSIIVRPDSPTPVWWIFGSIMAIEVLVTLSLGHLAAAADAQAAPVSLID